MVVMLHLIQHAIAEYAAEKCVSKNSGSSTEVSLEMTSEPSCESCSPLLEQLIGA